MPSQLGDMIVDADLAFSTSSEPERQDSEPPPGVLQLLRRALFFSNEPYAIVRDNARPGRRGLVIILTIVGIVALAQGVAYGVGWLTAPRLDSLQSLLYNTVVDLPWYAQQVQLDPAFAAQFQQGYIAAWEGLRILLGYPTVTVTGSTIVVTVLLTLLNWFVFSALSHWLARWYGSQARFGQTLGAVALAYAPLLLLIIQIVPGAVVPTSLLFFLMLAMKYLALKSVHGHGSAQTLFVLLTPYFLVAIVAALLLLNGGALGIEQIPYVNEVLKVQQFLAR